MEEMTDRREKSRERRLAGVGLSSLLLFPFLGMLPPCVTSQAQEMFLNSLVYCGQKDYKAPWERVDKFSLYNVKDDVSPMTRTHTFVNICQMIFRSTSSDGRLCLFQYNLLFTNDNMELRIYDGHEGVDGKDTPDIVVNRDRDLPGVEWCTSGQFLTIEMVPRDPQASVEDMVIDLMVYHMSSIHRKAFLDTSPSCGSTYKLDQSQVNVTNMDLSHRSTDIHDMCSLNFIYEGRNENRTLCLVFEPAKAPDGQGEERERCGYNYTLTVERLRGRSRQLLSFESRCKKPSAKKWCSNHTKLRLTLLRNTGQDFEKDVLFHVLVLDHEGDPNTLPLLFEKTEKTDESVATASTTVIIVVIALILVLIVIITIVITLVWRRRRHSPSRSPKKANGEVESNMLEKEHRSNHNNHYTQGTPQSA